MTPLQIKSLRSALNMTQTAFGVWLGGYSRSAVYKWEAGIKRPGMAVRGLIAERAKGDIIIKRALKKE